MRALLIIIPEPISVERKSANCTRILFLINSQKIGIFRTFLS